MQKNPGSRSHISNYEIAKCNAKNDFLKYDQDEMIKKWKLVSDEQFIYVEMLGRTYRVNRMDGVVEGSGNQFADCCEADYNETMTIYDLLCYAKKDAVLTGKFVSMQGLSAVKNASSYAGAGFFQAEEKELDHRTEELAAACKKLQGVQEGKGDAAYRIPVFGEISVLLQFWNSDEEFPARLNIYCDKNIIEFMHFETIWFLVSHLMARIRSEMS